MPHPTAFVLQLIDPRGRCNRMGLVRAAVVLLALQAAIGAAMWLSGADLAGQAALVLNAVFCWLGYAFIAKRLHDIGRSAWWIAAAVLVWLAVIFCLAVAIAVIGDPHLLAPGTTGYWITFATMVAPVLAGFLWLHVAEGETGDNRFGPEPGASGFSMPADAASWHRAETGPHAA